MKNIEDFRDEPSPENKEKFEMLTEKWSIIYDKFLDDVKQLQEEAGGKEKLDIEIWGKTIYDLALSLS